MYLYAIFLSCGVIQNLALSNACAPFRVDAVLNLLRLPNSPQLHRAFFHRGGVAVDADGQLEGGLVLRGDDLRERDLMCVTMGK